jgi:2-octaprenyl-6-methoxyphenol hydroxylase
VTGRTSTDILVAGAGPAGLIAAAAFAAAGARVLVADPATPLAADDRRSTALLRPARALLERIGVWAGIEPAATPLEALRIVDLAGTPPGIRTQRTFTDPAGPLGWNVPNPALRQSLADHLAGCAGVEIVQGIGVASLVNRSAEALVTLTDGRQVRTALAVAADGRASALREAAGLTVRTTRYGQKALAFAVTHPVPHEGISTELYLDGGPFTMVPLPDRDGRPASAIVWMSDGPEAVRLAQMTPEAFAEAASLRSAGVLGPLSLDGTRALWPVISQHAPRLVAGRVAVIAEAAHVVPPIGAQGLNMSIADVACLADLLATHAPGAPAMMEAYQARRAPDIAIRLRAIDLFNRTTRSPDALGQMLRQGGLALLHDVAPLRAAVMRAGMGA